MLLLMLMFPNILTADSLVLHLEESMSPSLEEVECLNFYCS
jgi:hypothetical protein